MAKHSLNFPCFNNASDPHVTSPLLNGLQLGSHAAHWMRRCPLQLRQALGCRATSCQTPTETPLCASALAPLFWRLMLQL